MREQIYIATFSENAIDVIRNNGFNIELNDLCISENLDPEKVRETMSEMKQEIADAGAERVIIHGPFTEIIPASIDHRAVELGLTRLNEAHAVAEKLGIKKMVVHSGHMPLLYFKEWHKEKSLYFWQEFMKDKPEDFLIYIENVFEDEPLMMKEIIEELNDSRIQICLDVGHANAVTCEDFDIHDWIRILGPMIGHFHLHNNDGKEDLHGPLDRGTMDMIAVLDSIKTYCRPDVTMTIESRTCASSAAWIIQHFK